MSRRVLSPSPAMPRRRTSDAIRQRFAAANSNDPIGVKLLQAGAAAIDETLDAVVRAGCGSICLLGGLAPHYPDWLAEAHRSRLVAPRADALHGAVELAVSRFAQREVAT